MSFQKSALLFQAQGKEYILSNIQRQAVRSAVPEIKMASFHNLTYTILAHYGNVKIVSIVRHQCGVIHSWLNMPGEFPEAAEQSVEWRAELQKNWPEEFRGFDDWMKVTRTHMEFEEKYPERFKILRYEDLASDLHEKAERLFVFLALPLGRQTQQFLGKSQASHRGNSYAVFKHPAVKGRWCDSLNEAGREDIVNKASKTGCEGF
ncbi:MAG: sulfotransferase [Gammaproteobacteria bacterium]